MNEPMVNGNTIIFPFKGVIEAVQFAVDSALKQFAVREIPDGFSLSTPITPALNDLMPGVIHGARCRAAEVEKPDGPTGPKGGPKGPSGKPPSGPTPGSPSVTEYVNTEARAA